MAGRFSLPRIGFALFLLDKNTSRFQTGPQACERTGEVAVHDEPDAPVPVWRTPQPQPHVHEDHEINMIVSGAGRYIWGDGHCVMASVGDIFVVPGGVSHIIEVDDHVVVRGLWIHPETFRRLPSCGHDAMAASFTNCDNPLPPRLVNDASLLHTVAEIFAQGQNEYSQGDGWRDDSLRALAQLSAITFVRLMRAKGEASGDHPTQWRVLNVKAWMNRHYAEAISVAELARMAGISVSQFFAAFRHLAGTSPKSYLMERRLNQVTAYLATTEMPISRIARMSGFEHNANFNHLFRERFGCTPTSYRKKHQKEARYQ
jgi:AraC-like DNA-binding protein/uncharacterized cupin superfamily protein